jgi:uncharacterized protein (UPF0332 family)
MNPETLIDKGLQALRSAQILIEHNDPNGACDRAYYAMFDVARAALVRVEGYVGKTHKGTLAAFSERFVRNGPISKETGRLLKHVEAYRNLADYQDESVTLEQAQDIVNQADLFVQEVCKECFPDYTVRHDWE